MCVTSARKCRCLRKPDESVASLGAGVGELLDGLLETQHLLKSSL